MNRPAIFCGVVRNGGKALTQTLERLQLVRTSFSKSKFFIVTNDNNDSTDQTLRSWAEVSASSNIVLRADGLLTAFPNRIDRICAARNFYLFEVQREINQSDWSYVIVADMDGPNVALDGEWFKRLEQVNFQWDALFANQDTCYYDIYALRHPSWCPNDCWVEAEQSIPRIVRRIPKLSDPLRRMAAQKYVFARQQKIPKQYPPIRVSSAFGGLGIYRTSALQGVFYGSRTENNHVICEHVVLNKTIESRGGSLFIMPSLINIAPDEHTSHSSGGPFRGYKYE